MMINPERSTANEIFRLLQFPSSSRGILKGPCGIVELVPAGQPSGGH